MKVTLDKKDIIDEILANYNDDTDLIFDIIDVATGSWGSIRNITIRVLKMLKDNGELDQSIKDIIEKD